MGIVEYTIGETFSFNIPQFTQVPNCNYDLLHTPIEPVELESSVSFREDTRTFTITEMDNNFEGTYLFTVDASYGSVSSNPDL